MQGPPPLHSLEVSFGRTAARFGRTRAGRDGSALRSTRVSALPRPPGVPLDLEARRHRFRAHDRPQPRRCAADSPRSSSSTPLRSRAARSPRTARRSSCSRLADGKQIESVFIPDTPAQTFCISTQVGCAMGCAFCLTGKMGLVRHLSAGEIAGQVACAGARAGVCRRTVQHRSDGHGRAAAQLRRRR